MDLQQSRRSDKGMDVSRNLFCCNLFGNDVTDAPAKLCGRGGCVKVERNLFGYECERKKKEI